MWRAEPVYRSHADKRQRVIQDTRSRRVHHDLPHQRGDHGWNHQWQQHHGAHRFASRDVCVQEQCHGESQRDLDRHRHDCVSDGEFKGTTEQRSVEQAYVVVQPDEAEAFGKLQPIVGEAVVEAEGERIHHSHEKNECRCEQQVWQEPLLPGAPAHSLRLHWLLRRDAGFLEDLIHFNTCVLQCVGGGQALEVDRLKRACPGIAEACAKGFRNPRNTGRLKILLDRFHIAAVSPGPHQLLDARILRDRSAGWIVVMIA